MDAETAALFPSSFADDGLPVGWANKALGDIILPKRGKTITKSKTKEGTIPVVAGGLEPAYFHNQSNVEAPVVTISASGANAGFTRLYNENIWASDCSHISKQLTDTIYFWYVFLKINQQKIYHMQQGAAQPHIYPSDLIRLELTVPNDNKLIQHFENLISPYFQKISIAQKESKTLAELRDTLLPKLMSGEIRVKDAERSVEAAV
jgi:type I restriction enzyme S subunit